MRNVSGSVTSPTESARVSVRADLLQTKQRLARLRGSLLGKWENCTFPPPKWTFPPPKWTFPPLKFNLGRSRRNRAAKRGFGPGAGTESVKFGRNLEQLLLLLRTTRSAPQAAAAAPP